MSEPFTPPLQVLIVDEDPASVAQWKLAVEGHWGTKVQVTGLTDPHSAMLFLADHPCEILITGFPMSGADGSALLRHARSRSPMIQAIFVSGEPSVDTVLQAAQDGASDFLLKPVDPYQLIDRLEKAEARLLHWRQTVATALGRFWPLPTS